MANLLPHDIQEGTFARTLARALVASSVLLAVIALLALLALAPAYLTEKTEADSLAYEMKALSDDASSAGENQAEAAALTRRLQILGEIHSEASTTAAIKALLDARPADLSLSSIAYVRGTSGATSTPSTLTVSGTGATAGEQERYLAALRGIASFASVEIPIAALAHAGSDSLTIDISGTF